MLANHYEWVWGSSPPPLARHSEVKHALLRGYLVEYFSTLVSSPHQDRIQLTIVDGFCGGGRYTTQSGAAAPGSPIVILQAIREAQLRIEIEQRRRKPIVFDVELICIDESPSAIDHLRHVLIEQGYENQLSGGSIRLLQGDFVVHCESAVAEARRRSPRAGRAVFILDQYGYDSVPLAAIQTIFSLHRAEVILTFAVDALINFLSEKNLSDFQRKTGIQAPITARELDEMKKTPGWRLYLQSGLYQGITRESGAEYFTPFFIRSERGHGDFWLVHLSRHWKARDVMTTTHWKHHNHFIHYGDAGLDMFATGYAARIDDADRPQRAFEFDDVAKTRSIDSMLAQIPRAIATYPAGVRFQDFFESRVNLTPATRQMISLTVLQLASLGELEVIREDGKISTARSAINGEHVLRLPKQRTFSFPGTSPGITSSS
ncbi:MAG: three-Cys-motif partner protein TcmP [Ramlibacter sp.]|nr:three-Cys-motif partner protein TcmP [Ramlibacter sp.]